MSDEKKSMFVNFTTMNYHYELPLKFIVAVYPNNRGHTYTLHVSTPSLPEALLSGLSPRDLMLQKQFNSQLQNISIRISNWHLFSGKTVATLIPEHEFR